MPLTASSCSLLISRTSGLAIAKPVAERRQAFREPLAAFVEDQRGADLSHFRNRVRPGLRLGGKESEEQEAVGWQAGQR